MRKLYTVSAEEWTQPSSLWQMKFFTEVRNSVVSSGNSMCEYT